MKKLIVLLFISWAFANCKTVEHFTTTKTTVEIRDTTLFLNDTLSVDIPRDTLIISGITPIISNKMIRENKHFESDLISADIQITISGDSVQWDISATTKDTSVEVVEQDTVKLKGVIQNTKTENTTYLPPERYVPKFHKFTFWLFWAELVVVVLFFVLRYYSGKLYAILRKIISK